jgi:CopA family copper-resistance protein
VSNMISRRSLLSGSTAVGGLTALNFALPAWARSARANDMRGLTALSGTTFDLHVARTPFAVEERQGSAITVNGQVPAPLLRWREGDDLTLRVTNHLNEDTSIHWHGILLPYEMDGVPGVTFPGIKPGETFTYKFPVKQAGTYWYHSHSGVQEQVGHFGPLIIEPKGADPVAFDREYVVVLSDWTFEDPDTLYAKLKKRGHGFNYQKLTLGDFFRDVRARGFGAAFKEKMDWDRMRMERTDILDITGETYTYLVNGHGPGDNWTALFKPGERVRLRFINAAAMTIFNVRIPGLPMTLVQADGLDVRPVETDEFQIGVAETYDVVVRPTEDRAFTIMSEAMDLSGFGLATLATRPGMEAPIPPLRERPLLSMKDMGMDHDAMGHAEMDHDSMSNNGGAHEGHDMPMDKNMNMDMDMKPEMKMEAPAEHDHGAPDHLGAGEPEHDHSSHERSTDVMEMAAKMQAKQAELDHGSMDHSSMNHDGMEMSDGAMEMQRHDHPGGPGVVNEAMAPTNRLGERGLGLENEPHRVLVYTDLASLAPNPDQRAPEREMELHLTSNMERYMWSFDGVKFSEVDGPLIFREGERLRLTMVNDTMMAHPIHLHGMFFDVVTGGDHAHKPRKHTIVIKPGEKLSVDITADALGDWAFHCHLLYHMRAGMMRVVSVRKGMARGMMDHQKMDRGEREHMHHDQNDAGAP